MQFDAERRIASGLRTAWIALATFLGVIALSVALVVAFEHAIRIADDLSRKDEQQLVARFVARSLETQASSELGLLSWDEAIRHIQSPLWRPGGGPTSEMLWLDREFGHYAWATYNADRSFLVQSDGTLIRAWANGRPDGDGAYRQLNGAIGPLLARSMRPGQVLGVPVATVRLGVQNAGARPGAPADSWKVAWPIDRAGSFTPRWAGGLVRTDHGVSLITVGSVVPDHDPAMLSRAPVWFVTTQPLDPRIILRMRRELLLPDLGLTMPDDPAASAKVSAHTTTNMIPLTGIDGAALGWIRWSGKKPPGRRSCAALRRCYGHGSCCFRAC